MRITLTIATLVALPVSAWAAEQDKQALMEEALAAAPPTMSESVKVVDWEGNVLREGEGEYTCFPTPPPMREQGKAPMCLDEQWTALLDAWMKKEPFETDRVGIGYMLAGDVGTSNVDPFAESETADNEWIVEGPHLMVIVPDAAQLEGMSTDPESGGAYVMWKGTPYAHLMVPVGERPE